MNSYLHSRLLLKRYFAACKQYRWAALTSFTCVAVLASLVAALQPESRSLYLAQKALLYRPTVAATRPPVAKSAVDPSDTDLSTTATADAAPESPAPMVQAMPDATTFLSDPLLQRTTTTLRLKQHALPPQLLRRHLTFQPDPQQGDRWLVQFQDTDAERSALVVDAFVDAIAQQDIDQKRQQGEAVIRVLEQRRGLLEEKLRVAEEQLRQFSRQKKPAIQQAIDGSLVSAITTIQQQQRELRRSLKGTDAEIASLQNQLQMTPEQAYLISAISADSAVNTLSGKIDELAVQQQIQSQELQPLHPDMVAMQYQQTVYETRLQQRIQDIVGSGRPASVSQAAVQALRARSLDETRQELANRLVNLKSQRDRLAQELEILSRSEPELRQNYSDGTSLTLDLEKYTKELTRHQAVLEQTEQELAAAEVSAAETSSDWLSEAAPQVKQVPTWMWSRPFILLVGGGVGLCVAGATVMVCDQLRGKILIPEEVQAILKNRVAMLGLLPAIAPDPNLAKPPGKHSNESSLPVLFDPDAPELQAYELFRSSLIHPNPKLKVVMLSSIGKGEGKTVSAYNLAIAAARAGKKTLLIEADLRAASQADILGVDIQAGHTANSTLCNDQIQAIPQIKNLFILPSSGNLESISEALESEQTQQLLQQARDDFDFVVLDATTLHFSDVLVLEPLTDGLILVTRPGYTERRSLKNVIEKLAESNTIKLLGTVVNHVSGGTHYTPLLSL